MSRPRADAVVSSTTGIEPYHQGVDWVFGALAGVLVGAVVARQVVRPRTPPVMTAVDHSDVLPVGVLGAVLDALLSGAVVVDGDGQVVFVNPAAKSMHIARAGRLAVPELSQLVRDVRRARRPKAVDVDLPDGQAVHAQAAVAGASGHLLLLLDDITESRRVDAVRRDFVANVSHELKTPVGALSLLAEALLGGVDDPEAVRRFAARMQHESQRLGRLVQELIDLSRLQGAEPMPEGHLVAVDAVVGEAVDRTRLAASAKDITVVAGSGTGLLVHGDERQLVTSVANLLDNAIAYSAAGTRVSVGTRQRATEVEIAVADEGIGIATDDVERIFERFYRADPARSRETGGTGLGLAIVKHIATNHGGRVSVWSVEGTGSTFTLHLPMADHDDSAPVTTSAPQEGLIR